MEVIVDDMRNITKATACNQPPPPLVVLSISMKTVLNHKSKQNEIVALSGIVHYAGNQHSITRWSLTVI
jgi:hypothetical protein